MRIASYLWIAVLVVALFFAGCDKSKSAPESAAIKIGFLVKQPEEPWFQDEWKFAEKAAAKDHFTLIKIGAVNGPAVLAAIDNLGAQGAQGMIICTPDVHLGPAIVNRAQRYGIKVFSVDDRFLGADGKPMTDVPYMGISATNIGHMVGKALWAEMQKRGWKLSETGACVPTRAELATALQRTDGAIAALEAAGFPKNQIYTAPQKTTDVPGGRDAANVILTQHSGVKHWLIAGMNDEAVLGAVRAMENRGFKASDVIGIGIGGDTGKVDFEKPEATGFFASVLLSPRRHGEETSDMMYQWIKTGKKPPMTTFTTGTLITRADYKRIMKEQGL